MRYLGNPCSTLCHFFVCFFVLQNLKSAFGAFLDPVADKLMVTAVLLLLCTQPIPAGPLAGNTWLLPVCSLGELRDAGLMQPYPLLLQTTSWCYICDPHPALTFILFYQSTLMFCLYKHLFLSLLHCSDYRTGDFHLGAS